MQEMYKRGLSPGISLFHDTTQIKSGHEDDMMNRKGLSGMAWIKFMLGCPLEWSSFLFILRLESSRLEDSFE